MVRSPNVKPPDFSVAFPSLTKAKIYAAGKVRPESEGEHHLALWLERLKAPTFVYIVQSGEPIKVGFAHDVRARIASLQTGNPVTIDLLHVLPGDQRLEWFLHRRLKDCRLRGEWFNAGESFLAYVSDLANRMVEAYDGSGTPPHYVDLDPAGFTCREDQKRNPIKVTYMEPKRSEAEREVEKTAKAEKGEVTTMLLTLGYEEEFTRAQREGYDRDRAERLREAAWNRYADRFPE